MFSSVGCLDLPLLSKTDKESSLIELQFNKDTQQCRLFDKTAQKPICGHTFPVQRIACHLLSNPGKVCPECGLGSKYNPQEGITMSPKNLLSLAPKESGRTMISTTEDQQITVQTLEPLRNIPKEIHLWSSQLISVLKGKVRIMTQAENVHGSISNTTITCNTGETFLIPRHTWHEITNPDSTESAVFVSLYTPPMHPPGVNGKEAPSNITSVFEAVAPFTAQLKKKGSGILLACGYGPAQLIYTVGYQVVPNHCQQSLMIFAPMECEVKDTNVPNVLQMDMVHQEGEVKRRITIRIKCSHRSTLLYEYLDSVNRNRFHSCEKVATIRFSSEKDKSRVRMNVSFTILESEETLDVMMRQDLDELVVGQTLLFEKLKDKINLIEERDKTADY